ncbi:unnamed protein product [Gadus morhua 'NCC']
MKRKLRSNLRPAGDNPSPHAHLLMGQMRLRAQTEANITTVPIGGVLPVYQVAVGPVYQLRYLSICQQLDMCTSSPPDGDARAQCTRTPRGPVWSLTRAQRASRERGFAAPGLLVFWARGGGGGGGGCCCCSWFVSASESTPLGIGVDSPPGGRSAAQGHAGFIAPPDAAVRRSRCSWSSSFRDGVPFKVIRPTTGSDGLFSVE